MPLLSRVLALSSPRPWTYHNSRGETDWIEDANGTPVVHAVGRLDGPLICAAVNYLYTREADAEAAVRQFLDSETTS